MKRICGVIFLVLSLSTFERAVAQDITNFTDGRITFETVSNGQYQVEWRASLLDSSDWSSTSPFGMIVATGTSTSVAVPMFYRIVWLNPPPYSITGSIRSAGVATTGITDTVELELVAGGTKIYTTPSLQDGTFSFDNISNGSYRLSLSANGYFTHESEVQLVNDDVSHNIDLETPILPISPTNQHIQSGGTVSFMWEDIPSANFADLSYYHETNGLTAVFHSWAWQTNACVVTNLPPGTYHWFVQLQKTEMPADHIPVGHFTDWQSFTINE